MIRLVLMVSLLLSISSSYSTCAADPSFPSGLSEAAVRKALATMMPTIKDDVPHAYSVHKEDIDKLKIVPIKFYPMHFNATRFDLDQPATDSLEALVVNEDKGVALFQMSLRNKKWEGDSFGMQAVAEWIYGPVKKYGAAKVRFATTFANRPQYAYVVEGQSPNLTLFDSSPHSARLTPVATALSRLNELKKMESSRNAPPGSNAGGSGGGGMPGTMPGAN